MSISVASSNISKSSSAIELFRGESKDLSLCVTQFISEAEVNECVDVYGPVDLTGSTLFFCVRKQTTDPASLIDKSSDDPIEIEILTPASLGKSIIHITSGDTVGLEAGKYFFDIWIQLSSGKRSPIIAV